MTQRKLFLFVFFLFLTPIYIAAQDYQAKRPKIAYVLSGGGAKGMAHVGVLKVLEEVGLEPDFITGTSMGSIMGGLYSIGYSADEISEIIETVDWSTVLTNEIPSDQVLMRRKHEYQRYLLTLPVYKGKPELPAGLIEGQKLSELFSELSWRQAGVDNFQDFPYPFSCIGTDILQGKKVEMNSGDLSSAMRASMAIPSVFTAVVRDSTHILVDGGVMRNFPVQEAIDMGADIIIGIYVGFDRNMKPEQLRSLTSVITRTSLLSGAMDVESQIPLADYLITPDLEGMTASSFTSGVEIMNQGEKAARKQIDILRALADSINSLGHAPERKELPRNDSILIEDIEVLDTSPAMNRFFVYKSGLEPGTWIKPEQLNESVDKLFGTLFFDKIEYYFENMEEGKRLVFRIKEKPTSSLGVALHYDNTFGPGVILNYTHLNSLVEGSRLGITADISGNPQFRAYYDIHVGKKRNFIASAFLQAQREKLPAFLDDVAVGDYFHSYFAGGASLNQSLGTNNLVGAELYYRYSNLKFSSGLKVALPYLEDTENFIFKGPELALLFQHNSFDNHLYPTKGTRFGMKLRLAYNTQFISNYSDDSLDVEYQDKEIMDPYGVFTSGVENYLPLSKKVSLNTGLGLGLSRNEKPFSDNFYVGGYRYNLRTKQVPFVGLNTHELLQGNFLSGKVAIQYKVISNLYLSALGNIVFVSDDILAFWDEIVSWEEGTHYIGAGAGFTYKTPVGPVSIYLGSRTDIWNPIWYTSIGFTF